MPFEIMEFELPDVISQVTGSTPLTITLAIVVLSIVYLRECRLLGEWLWPQANPGSTVQVTVANQGCSDPQPTSAPVCPSSTEPMHPSAPPPPAAFPEPPPAAMPESPSRVMSSPPLRAAQPSPPPTGAPQLPQVQWSPRPDPIQRQAGDRQCVHTFHIQMKNQHGYSYKCQFCPERWYRPWSPAEAHLQISKRQCTARVITEMTLDPK